MVERIKVSLRLDVEMQRTFISTRTAPDFTASLLVKFSFLGHLAWVEASDKSGIVSQRSAAACLKSICSETTFIEYVIWFTQNIS